MARVEFHWDDPLLLERQLSEDERMVQEAARVYAQERLVPRVREAFRNEHTDPAIFREMGELGLLGATIPERDGGGGLNYVSYGLIAREVERVDSGYRSMLSVLTRDAADLEIRQRGAAPALPPRPRARHPDRLLRSDGARSWLGPRQHDHARA